MANKCPKCHAQNPETSLFCSDCGTKLDAANDFSLLQTETLKTSLRELSTGSMFAKRYQIIEELGKGGMGRVYRSIDKKLNEEVAIKLIKPEIAADRKTLERFHNELKLARKISHRNVGRMYELMEEKDAHFITMEYVPGQDLRGLIRQTGQLTVGKAMSIARQICEGLAEAHRLGIVHRDLKPSNIIIDKEGNIRIMDFGIARSLKARGITGDGVMIGTPEYMSPEQVEGKEVDQRSDIYSLGIVLYEMLTGQVPFAGDTPFTIGVKQKSEIPKDPKSLNPQIPHDLSRLVLKCLEKDKENRYQTADELGADLEKIEKGIPTAERPVPKRKTVVFKPITLTITRKKLFVPLSILAAVAVIAIGLWRFFPKQSIAPPPLQANKRIVVLPFENQGEPEEEYFAVGMTDEITARLSSISQLEVIGRASAMQYKKTDKTPQKIGEELRVSYILYGTVRWQKQPGGAIQVRVTPSLVRASDATQIWANPYDQTISKVFQVQADIAKRVAEALNIALLAPDQKAVEAKPTEIAEAYDYYLRGMDYYEQNVENKNKVELAIDLFEKTIALDPEFTQAYARLAEAHAVMYWMHFDHTKERIAKSKKAVDKALELGPDLVETHIALGCFYYHCMLDYDRALEQCGIVLKRQPRNSEILELFGIVKRRQGKLNDATAYLKRAFEINPRSGPLALYLGQSNAILRNYAEAEKNYDQAIWLSPDYDASYFWKARLYLSWTGDLSKATEVFNEATQRIVTLDESQIPYLWILVGIFSGDYQEDLARLSSISAEVFDTQFYFIPKDQIFAQIYGLMNNEDKKKEYYHSAQKYLENKIKEQPDDSRLYSSLGISYAGLGLKEKAIQEAIKAAELLPISKEFWRGTYRVKDLAQVYAMVGEYDKAIDKIEYLLSITGEMSIPLLKIDPVWAPLRAVPRFQMLLSTGGAQ